MPGDTGTSRVAPADPDAPAPSGAAEPTPIAPWSPAAQTNPPPPSDPSAHAPPPAPNPAPAPPSPAPPPHPLQVRLAVDIPVIALGLTAYFGTDLAGRDLRWAGCAACDRSALGGLDRRVLGNENLAAAHASDALLATAIAAPFVADLADALTSSRRGAGGLRHGARGWAKDVVVLAEVLSTTLGLTNLVKFAVRRPRPYSYEATSPLGDVHDNEARLSFLSGHASVSMAMATAYATVFTFRHPRARAAVPVWTLALGLGAVTSVLRVEAGKHFWTDVIAGSIAGASLGVLVPFLHRARPGAPTPALQPTRGGAALTLSGAF